MREYNLVLNDSHFAPMLEALRLHQIAVKNAPSSEQENNLIANLVRRVELLQACARAGANLREAERVYNEFCEDGDAPTVAPVIIKQRII